MACIQPRQQLLVEKDRLPTLAACPALDAGLTTQMRCAQAAALKLLKSSRTKEGQRGPWRHLVTACASNLTHSTRNLYVILLRTTTHTPRALLANRRLTTHLPYHDGTQRAMAVQQELLPG